MKRIRKAAMMSIGVALLWAGLTPEVQGYTDALGGTGLDQGVGQVRSHLLCADCPQGELDATPLVSSARSYSLYPPRGQVVMEVSPEDASLRYPCQWLKSGDPLVETLAPQSQLFKKIKVSDLLREFLPAADGRLGLWTW